MRRGTWGFILAVAVLAGVLVPSSAAKTHPSLTLVWTVEPASAVHDTLITGAAYDTTASNVAVAVKYGGSIVASAAGVVTLTPSSGTFSNTSAPIVNGVAQFTLLTGSTVADGLTLTARAYGVTAATVPTATSAPFDISLTGEPCGGSCSDLDTPLGGGAQVTSSATGTFTFLAVSPARIPDSVTQPGAGCAFYHSVIDGGGFHETDGRIGASGTLSFTYAIPTSAILEDPFIGDGQRFVPLCAGGAWVDASGTAHPCYDATDPGNPGPWLGRALDPNTHNFNGSDSLAVCDHATGLYWGILGSFQDKEIDPTKNPTVTGWSSDDTSRLFFVSVPPPYDWEMG